MTLARKNDHAALVTYEGKVIAFDVEKLSYAVEERIRLTTTDYVIGSFIIPADTSLLCVTQTGKVIQRDSKSIETSKSSSIKRTIADSAFAARTGNPLYGRGGGKDTDQIAILDAAGKINIHDVDAMTGSGSVEAEGLILSIGLIQAEGGKRRVTS